MGYITVLHVRLGAKFKDLHAKDSNSFRNRLMPLTWVASEPSRQANRPPYQLSAIRHLLSTMAPPTTTQLPYKEADILPAIDFINRKQIKSERRAVSTYMVPRSTLRDRRAGTISQRDCEANSKKLTKLEEEAIKHHILDLDSRGFAPILSAIRDIANKLLAKWGAGQVKQKWPSNFVRRTPNLII